RMAVPEVSGRRMSSGATSAAGSGGHSEDRLYTLSPIAWATVIVDSTVQARPAFAPLSHCPLVQRGQTLPWEVRCTLEARFTCSVVSPVCGSIVPVGLPFQR